MTTATHLTALVGDDDQHFSSDQKSNAISLAQSFLGTSDGDSDPKDVATAMLAQRILLNLLKSADDQSTFEELVTDDIRRLATDSDDYQSDEDVFIVDTDPPTETWY